MMKLHFLSYFFKLSAGSKSLILLVFSLFLGHWALKAQSQQIKGTITNTEDGSTIPGVTVLLKGTTYGTVSDVDGNYELSNVPRDGILVFSFVGFETQEILVGKQKELNVALKPTKTKLNEVLIVGMGQKRESREIGYSVQKIETKALERAGSSNVFSALAGRTSGMQVTQSDGVEGGTTRIVIRGNNNLTRNNQPLIVIDNIALDNKPGLDNIKGGVDWGNPLSDINPYDIESLTILEGGAASAQYGERGANGAILIKLKRGITRKGFGVSYNMNLKVAHPYLFRSVQNKYGGGGPVGFTEPTFPIDGDGIPRYPDYSSQDLGMVNANNQPLTSEGEFGYYGSSVSWGPEMKGQNIRWWDGEMREYSPQPDNLKSAFHNGFDQTHNIAIEGGNEKGTIRLSLTHNTINPIIDNSNQKRTTIFLGSNINITPKATADISVTYVKFNRLNSPIIGEDENSINKGFLYSWPRSYKGIDKENYENADGTLHLYPNYPFKYVSSQLWWNYYNNNTWQDRDKYTASMALNFQLLPWLSLTTKAGRDFYLEEFTSKYKPIDNLGLKGGEYSNSLYREFNNDLDAMLTAEKKAFLNTPVDVSLTTGASQWDKEGHGLRAQSGTWYYPNMYTLFNYTAPLFYTDPEGRVILTNPQEDDDISLLVPKETILRQRINSIFAFLKLNYKNTLIVDLTGRNDWSSTLPASGRSYFYPSASVSYILSESKFFKEKFPWVFFLKLRGAIAQTATSADPYQKNYTWNTSLFGGQQSSALPSKIPPFMLKPQRVNNYEAGFNLGLFDNDIDLKFTYYYKYSFDQIVDLPISTSAGAPKITINNGVMDNRGIEIDLITIPYKTNNIVTHFDLRFLRNRNYVRSLGGHASSLIIADIWGLNGPAVEASEGQEYGTITGYDYLYDPNGNRILNEEGTKYLITDNRVPLGNASPDFTASANAGIDYKDFHLGFLINTKWGGDIYCGSYVINLQTGQSPETLKERDGGGLPYTDPDGVTRNVGVILEGVHQDGTPNTTVVHYYYKYMPNAGGWGKFPTRPGILENTWVKMQEISLSYSIPRKWIENQKVFQGLEFNLTGRDLFYLYKTLPDNINPEGIISSGNAQAIEWAAFPGTRSIIFGLNAKF